MQQPILFSDGSMIRLTIARYYTPSGRCIQKPYGEDSDSYADDLLARYRHGEYFSEDSIKHTGPAYHTSIGRTVYGGGGITPDIFVPEDTTNMTSYYKEAAMSGLMLQYAFQYTDEHRQELKKYDTMNDLLKIIAQRNIVDNFASFAEKKGLQRRNLLIRRSHRLLEHYLYSRIIYNMLDEEAWLQYLNSDDAAIKITLDVFKRNESFPKKPQKK